MSSSSNVHTRICVWSPQGAAAAARGEAEAVIETLEFREGVAAADRGEAEAVVRALELREGVAAAA